MSIMGAVLYYESGKTPMETDVRTFLTESLLIEGYTRSPTLKEVEATVQFLQADAIRIQDLCTIQAVYAPGKPLRDREGMNVRVGGYRPPKGGPAMEGLLTALCADISEGRVDPWHGHVRFENLHPFMDGNGRTGRAVWAWHMLQDGQDPFSLPFLHRFYYQTLANSEGRR